MKKNLGILILLLVVCAITFWLNPNFLTTYNLENLILRASLYGIIGIGVSFVIITGGIDLSIGSVIGLVGCLLPTLLITHDMPVMVGLGAILFVGVTLGLTHGLLITKLKLQPFVVTLCGLLIYRGVARWFTGDATQGFGDQFGGLRMLARGQLEIMDLLGLTKLGWPEFGLPYPFLIMIVLAVLAAVFLNMTIYGRYMLALGRNEPAARYSGINTTRVIILAYVICTLFACLGGVLFALHLNSIQPQSFGNFYELYAIAAAVLGGCSLRGGEGSILGVVIGAALMRVLYNSINLVGIPTTMEFAIIGFVILVGVIVDELVKRYSRRRRAKIQAAAASSKT